jgi:hypothetical protein
MPVAAARSSVHHTPYSRKLLRTRNRKEQPMDEILAQTLASLETSEPVSHGLLHIFPLRGGARAERDLSLLEDSTLRRQIGDHKMFERRMDIRLR